MWGYVLGRKCFKRSFDCLVKNDRIWYTSDLRVAFYGRVSKDDGKQDTENQLHELREFCIRSGWHVEHEYVDRASGKTSDRPQFKRMFEDAAKRRFDLVLFWALDRFSREGTLETLQYLQRLSAWGVD